MTVSLVKWGPIVTWLITLVVILWQVWPDITSGLTLFVLIVVGAVPAVLLALLDR
jgi:hypothetical protein